MNYLINTPAQLSLALKSARKAKELTQAAAAAKVGLLPKTYRCPARWTQPRSTRSSRASRRRWEREGKQPMTPSEYR